MIDTYNQAGYVRNMETYGLRNMIRALSIMELLNTEEENQRLALDESRNQAKTCQFVKCPLWVAFSFKCPIVRNVNQFPYKNVF